MLLGDQANPGSQLTTVLENLGIGDRSRQSAGNDRTDAGNGLQTSAGVVCAVPGIDIQFDGMDFPVYCQELPRQTFQAGAGQSWQPLITLIGDHSQQLLDLWHASWRNDAKLRHMSTDGIDQHGSLPNQQIPGSVQYQD